jgi:hypothetical protein
MKILRVAMLRVVVPATISLCGLLGAVVLATTVLLIFGTG